MSYIGFGINADSSTPWSNRSFNLNLLKSNIKRQLISNTLF